MTTVGFVAFTIIGLLGGLRPAACRAGWPRWSLVGSVLFSAGTVILVMVLSRSLDEHDLWLHTLQGDRYYVPPDAGGIYLFGLVYEFAATNSLTIYPGCRFLISRQGRRRAAGG